MNIHRSWLINILLVGLIIVIGMQSGCDSGSRSSYVPGIGGAYSEADMQKLKDTGNCVNCSRSGADLTQATIDNADMVGASMMNVTGPTGMSGQTLKIM